MRTIHSFSFDLFIVLLRGLLEVVGRYLDSLLGEVASSRFSLSSRGSESAVGGTLGVCFVGPAELPDFLKRVKVSDFARDMPLPAAI